MKKFKLGNGAAVNSLLLTSVHVVTAVLGLLVTKLLSVNFSLGEYGTYSQATLVTSTVASLSILGLTNATNYYYNRTPDEQLRRTYVATIFTLQYIIGVISSLVILVSRNQIAQYFGNAALSGYLVIVAFTPFMYNLIYMYQTLFVSIGQAKKIAVRNFVVSSVRLIAVCIACYVTK